MERKKHPLKEFGNGPYHHHYHEGSFNTHVGDHRGNTEKNKQKIKEDHTKKKASEAQKEPE